MNIFFNRSNAILVIILVVTVLLIARSDFFNIRNVEITGEKNECWDEEKIGKHLKLKGQNIFLVNTDFVTKGIIDNFICINKVNIFRSFPKDIKIGISTRKAAAVLVLLSSNEATTSSLLENLATPSAKDIQDQYIIDSEGVIFSKSSGENIQRIFLSEDISLGSKLKADLISKILKILEKTKVLGIETKDTLLRDDLFFINPYLTTPKIIFRLSDSVDIQLASLQLILEKSKIDGSRLEFIDLRFDKPVVKFTPKESNGKR